MIDNVEDFITHLEGRCNRAYKDIKGHWTTGIGHLIEPDEEYLINEILSEARIDSIFSRDIGIARLGAERYVKNFDELDDVRQAAVLSMIFNMGAARFSRFIHFIAALEHGDFQAAEKEIYNSDWADELPARVEITANMISTGEWV